ncbi:MAG: MFS transporter [Phycisphaerales bacterium]|nr:MFS transporter [Phycisphaerales bacterium]
MPVEDENNAQGSAGAPAQPPPPDRHDAYAAIRSANYRRFAFGFAASSLGLQMLATAIGYEIYERTNDVMMLGYAGLARAAPVMLFALVSGHAVDAFDRKKIVTVTQFAFAGVAAGLAVVSLLAWPLWMYFALLFMAGCVRSFNGPSRNALMPLLVERADFENAVKWTTGLFQFSAVSGPIIAGGLIDASGRAWPVYAAMAVLCVVFGVAAIGLRPRAQVRSAGKLTPASLMAGIGHLKREKSVLGALLVDLFAVLVGGATALIPVYVTDVLLVSESWQATAQGVLRASLYVGALVMAVLLAHRRPFKRAGWWLLGCVAFFGLCTVLYGLSTSFWFSVGLLFLAGAADQVSVVIRHVLVQVRTPDELRGRVGAVNSLFIECSNELGAYESGLVAFWFGPVVSVVSGGVGTIVIVALLAWLLPDLRRLGSLNEPQDEPERPRAAG